MPVQEAMSIALKVQHMAYDRHIFGPQSFIADQGETPYFKQEPTFAVGECT